MSLPPYQESSEQLFTENCKDRIPAEILQKYEGYVNALISDNMAKCPEDRVDSVSLARHICESLRERYREEVYAFLDHDISYTSYEQIDIMILQDWLRFRDMERAEMLSGRIVKECSEQVKDRQFETVCKLIMSAPQDAQKIIKELQEERA
ncbi:MAG: hypothetical protein WC373_01730 [Smithella sp.]|jgi:hypothetical protein